MKKILIYFVLVPALLIALVYGSFHFIVFPKAENIIRDQLSLIGYNDVRIDEISAHIYGFSIPQMSFGEDQFNTITNLRAWVEWPEFILTGKLRLLSIEQINISSVTHNLREFLIGHKKFNPLVISQLPAKEIRIKNVIWDTSTDQGAIRVEGALNLLEEGNTRLVRANISARQHNLTFTSLWNGLVDADGVFKIEGNFEDMHAIYGPLQLNRGTGWIAYESKNGDGTLSGQLEAGSGKVFAIPASNIALVIGQEDDYFPILFRAEASGIDHVRFTTDIHYAATPEKQAFNAGMQIQDIQAFVTYLEQIKMLSPDTGKKIEQVGETNIFLTYMPDKRFADGPAPFDINIKQNGNQALTGTFLIYPDSLDIRGTTQSSQKMITTLKALSLAKEENITDETIRLDGNLRSILSHTYK